MLIHKQNSLLALIFKCLVVIIYVCKYSEARSSSRSHEVPSFLKICHRTDPKINDCIKQSVEALRPYLKKGIPEFGIPSCEPLEIPEVILDQGTGAVSVRSTYTDIKVYGPTEFVLKSIKLDLDKERVRIKLYIPELYMTSKYSMEGRILMLPISGSGQSRGNYSNIDATVSMQGEQIDKNGERYLNIKDLFVDFNIGHAAIQLDDLFNGDQELGDAMNLFLNDNWRNVANEIKPVLEDTIGNLFKKICNKIYHKYPVTELLPP